MMSTSLVLFKPLFIWLSVCLFVGTKSLCHTQTGLFSGVDFNFLPINPVSFHMGVPGTSLGKSFLYTPPKIEHPKTELGTFSLPPPWKFSESVAFLTSKVFCWC